jgi:MoaA/NifB/PqqE/SkfB family radical SAM enzyme
VITSLPFRILGTNAFREFEWPVVKPFNLTYSVTGRCNSKCMTCNIWKAKPDYEMTTGEWKKVIKGIGKCPEWVTISGGEPFLRDDLDYICGFIKGFNKPHILNIATNGILTDKIVEVARKINHKRLIINVSIDGTREVHNKTRGVECFDKALGTVKRLKEAGFAVGVHLVVSKHNAHEIEGLFEEIKMIKPDSFICQVAENREELLNIGEDCSPTSVDYSQALDIVKQYKSKWLTRILRNSYYKRSIKHLDAGYSGRCFAGIASAHVNYNGDLWACCVKAEKMGNLMERAFSDLWQGPDAERIRARIKADKCSCTLANSAYSNFICSPF